MTGEPLQAWSWPHQRPARRSTRKLNGFVNRVSWSVGNTSEMDVSTTILATSFRELVRAGKRFSNGLDQDLPEYPLSLNQLHVYRISKAVRPDHRSSSPPRWSAFG
jgi:hypothetical protein